MMFLQKKQSKRGIVSLFAVVFLTIASTISVGVFTLLIGEFKLAGIQRESVKAFYAADAGIECALYWELRHDSFNISESNEITCGEGIDATVFVGNNVESAFTMPMQNGACAVVTVEKNVTGAITETHIQSRGKNNCDNPKVERAAEVTIRS